MTERTLNPYTRRIDKEYQRLLFKSAVVNTDAEGKQSFAINPSDIQDAKDYLITALYGMGENEVANLSIKEYDELSKNIDEFIVAEKGGSNPGNPGKVSKNN